MSKGLSRRDFMKASLIGGAALGAGLGHGHFHLTYAQSANVRFSTWHVPVGYEVKTVWEPMLEELKKKSGGKITSTMYAGGALGKGPEHYDIVSKGHVGHGLLHRDLDTRKISPDRCALSCSLGGRQRRCHGNRQCHVRASPQDRVPGRQDDRIERVHPGLHVDKETRQDPGRRERSQDQKPRRPPDQLHQGPWCGADLHAPGRRVHGHGNRDDRRHCHLSAAHPLLQAL